MLSRLTDLPGSEENRLFFHCHGWLKSQVSGLEEVLTVILQRGLIGLVHVDIWNLAVAGVDQDSPCRHLYQVRQECDNVVSGQRVFRRTKGRLLD